MGITNLVPSTSSATTVKSLTFPFQRGATSFPSLADPAKVVFYHIMALLLTGKNERVMSPDQGVNIHSYVFEDLTPITMARISAVVVSGLAQWVPEAKVINVVPVIEKNEDGTQSTITLNIAYRVANQSATMQIPLPMGLTSP